MYAMLQHFLRSVMDAIVEKDAQAEKAKETELNNWIQSVMRPPAVVFNAGGEASIVYPRNREISPLLGELLGDLLNAIGNQSLRRCEVCRSVFEQSRRKVKYCSDRCSSRAQSQLFYKRHKEATQEKIAA